MFAALLLKFQEISGGWGLAQNSTKFGILLILSQALGPVIILIIVFVKAKEIGKKIVKKFSSSASGIDDEDKNEALYEMTTIAGRMSTLGGNRVTTRENKHLHNSSSFGPSPGVKGGVGHGRRATKKRQETGGMNKLFENEDGLLELPKTSGKRPGLVPPPPSPPPPPPPTPQPSTLPETSSPSAFLSPHPPKAPEPWSVLWDPTRKAYYYVNKETYSTQWSNPSG